MLSIDHLYAFCRAKQDASIPSMQTQKEMFDVKNPKSTIYGYISQNICMTTNEDGPKNFFLPKSK